MSDYWFAFRKDIFIRDLVRDFLSAKLYFDAILLTYRKTSSVPFAMMNTWVGTENSKGPLWKLKDQCHCLFRSSHYNCTAVEHLFDWTIGSIFHEAMKLKENSYQIETYKPLLNLDTSHYKVDKDILSLIKDHLLVIDNSCKNIPSELSSIRSLFAMAIAHLKQVFLRHNDNILLVRFLLDNKRLLDDVYGKHSFTALFQHFFPGGLANAYLFAAEHCRAHGWFDDASRYLHYSTKQCASSRRLTPPPTKLSVKKSSASQGEHCNEKSKSSRSCRK